MILNPFIYQSGGGSGPILLVTVTGATATSVTAVNGGQSVSLTYDNDIGKWWAMLPRTGMWTVTAVSSHSTSQTATISATNIAVYEAVIQLGHVPAGYTELEYLQTSGTQYIDSGMNFSNRFRFVGTIEGLSANQIGQCAFFGAYDNGSPWGRNLILGNINDYFEVGRGAGYYYAGFSLNTKYNVDIETFSDPPVVVVNGNTITKYGQNSGSGSTTKNALIFAMMGGDSPVLTGGRIYGNLKVYSSSGATNPAISTYPAKRNSDSVLGLYDLARSTFLTNAGTGSFIAGPEL